jgi:hypothetical protein
MLAGGVPRLYRNSRFGTYVFVKLVPTGHAASRLNAFHDVGCPGLRIDPARITTIERNDAHTITAMETPALELRAAIHYAPRAKTIVGTAMFAVACAVTSFVWERGHLVIARASS